MALTYPLVTLSTRSQVESKKANTSVVEAVKRILEREGVAGLYSGLESALFGITVTNFVYYYCKCRSPFRSSDQMLMVSTRVRVHSGLLPTHNLQSPPLNPRIHGRRRPCGLRNRAHHQPNLGRQHPHDRPRKRVP